MNTLWTKENTINSEVETLKNDSMSRDNTSENAVENGKEENMENIENEIDVYNICTSIMDAGKVETIYPKGWYNKKNVLSVNNFAKSDVDGINERLFNDCRKPSEKQADDKRIKALVCFFKSMNDTNKIIKGYEIGFNKLNNMFMSWTDGKYTFNLKNDCDLKTIGLAVAVATLKGYCPSNLMYRIYTNRDGARVIRVTDFLEGFYQWKKATEKTQEEIDKENKKALADAVNTITTLAVSLTDTEKRDLLKSLESVLKTSVIGEIIKKVNRA